MIGSLQSAEPRPCSMTRPRKANWTPVERPQSNGLNPLGGGRAPPLANLKEPAGGVTTAPSCMRSNPITTGFFKSHPNI
jgi:hypothetical protein